MNTHITKLSALTGAFIFALGSSYAQNKEYDDLYFNANDRLKVKEVKAENRIVQNTREVRQLTANPDESYSARNINPEFLARYQPPSEDNGADYAEDEYFDEDYNNVESNYSNNDTDVVVRDRYGNTAYFDDVSDVYWSDPFYYEGSIFDPFYSPYRYGFHRYGYGYRPFRPGLSLSFGFGNSWAWRHGWHSGFSFGYGWGSGFYDPFYDPFYASYYSPFYNPYYGSYYGSYYGYGYPYGNYVVINNNYESRTDRTYRRGPGTSRSGSIATGNRSRRVVSVDNEDISRGRSSSTSRVAADNDPSGQGRYYRRSREAVINSDRAATTSRTYNSRSRSSSNYSTERSSTRTRSSYSRPSNDDYDYNRSRSNNSRTYSTPSRSRSSSYSNSRSNSSSRSYSTPSRSRSSSYSTGSSSRSSYGTRSSSSSSRSRRGGR